jgi:hypothetical protein
MAKVTAPLLGFNAAGQIGKTAVFGKWRGIQYARQHVIPANPNSAGQQLTRSLFTWLSNVFKVMPADAQAPWTANAAGRAYTNRNKFMGLNTKNMRGDTDLANFTGSPGAGGGLAAAAFTPSAGSGQITCVVTPPTLPTGWTLTKAVMIAISAQNPQTDTDYDTYIDTVTVSPWEPTITGLSAGDYQVSYWLEMTDASGNTVYGPSTDAAVTGVT